MRVYERIIWPALGLLDPERAHDLVLRAAGSAQGIPPLLGAVRALMPVRDPRLQRSWRGLTFPNPIGLAAGLDKDARAPRFFEALGFGFVEVGTVTPRPQPGNPRPRIHRLPARQAMVNSMGFPGHGAKEMAASLRRAKPLGVPLGINLGKNAATPMEAAAEDYVFCLERLYPLGDYFVVNVSSPNTQGLTSLQAKPALEALLGAVTERRGTLAKVHGQPPKPLLVKVSPDLTSAELDGVLDLCGQHAADGIIATNTSANAALKGPANALAGGISGKPLAQRSLEVIVQARRRGPPGLFIIGVGGVFDADGAWALFEAGADLVQLYTSFIYRGPGLPGAISRKLLKRLDAEGLAGFASIRQSPQEA